jgi:hypothetical protein
MLVFARREQPMARQPGRTSDADTMTAQAGQSDLASVVEALTQATHALVATTGQLMQVAQELAAPSRGGDGGHDRRGQGGPGSAGPGPGGPPQAQINIWEDDPFSEAVPTSKPRNPSPITVDVPSNGNPRLQTTIVEPRPAPGRFNPGTSNFRYWVAAEALTRGINFWGALLPSGTTWSTSNPMSVTLVAGVDLNAFYARDNGLNFFHQVVRGVDNFSGESSDVVCHELGHAILDALKPQLFNVASTEAGAFHESFGDMSAILCALQLPSLRSKVLAETDGKLNVNSRLSRLAEQLGWAIRQLAPTAVDRDCLRNAANRFVYRRPDTLPPSAPASLLSSEVHSFSRVFTGAFLDALARMFAAFGTPNDANLLAVSRTMGQLLVDGIRAAPVTPAYFSQVAAGMVQADQARNGGRFRSALTSAFVKHGILSVPAALALSDAPVPQPVAAEPGPLATAGAMAGAGSPIAYVYDGEPEDDGYRVGFGRTPELPLRAASLGTETVAVHVPDEAPRFDVAPASVANLPDETLSPDEASRHFIEDLFQQGRVDIGTRMGAMADLGVARSARVTHRIVIDGSGRMVLKRDHFDCGFCGRGHSAADGKPAPAAVA